MARPHRKPYGFTSCHIIQTASAVSFAVPLAQTESVGDAIYFSIASTPGQCDDYHEQLLWQHRNATGNKLICGRVVEWGIGGMCSGDQLVCQALQQQISSERVHSNGLSWHWNCLSCCCQVLKQQGIAVSGCVDKGQLTAVCDAEGNSARVGTRDWWRILKPCGVDIDRIELVCPFSLDADEVFNGHDQTLALSLKPRCSSCMVGWRRCSQSSQRTQ